MTERCLFLGDNKALGEELGKELGRVHQIHFALFGHSSKSNICIDLLCFLYNCILASYDVCVHKNIDTDVRKDPSLRNGKKLF